MPRAAVDRVAHAVDDEWGVELVRAWEHWIDLPTEVGDLLAEHVLGARPGEVAVSDSTTVNLYKLASAALDARPARRAIVADPDDFPSDRYVLEGLAAQRGLELRWADAGAVTGVIDGDVALVCLSHVNYRTGALADLPAVTAAAHEAGALVLWDLSHSAGSVPIALEADGVDLAVGCTYKYLNGGPGAPAFLYVRRSLHGELRQPLWGWFGQRDQFAMGPAYDPEPDVRRFLVGTPQVLGMHTVAAGVELIAEAGIDRVRGKGIALTELIVRLHDEWLAPLGFGLGSPRDPSRRGSHVALCHPDGARISVALRRARVIADFRAPDSVRLGPAPLYTRFVDVWDALDRLRSVVTNGEHESVDVTGRVT